MNGHVDKSIGIVTLIPEVLVKINPTVTLRVTKRVSRRKRNKMMILLQLNTNNDFISADYK